MKEEAVDLTEPGIGGSGFFAYSSAFVGGEPPGAHCSAEAIAQILDACSSPVERSKSEAVRDPGINSTARVEAVIMA